MDGCDPFPSGKFSFSRVENENHVLSKIIVNLAMLNYIFIVYSESEFSSKSGLVAIASEQSDP